MKGRLASLLHEGKVVLRICGRYPTTWVLPMLLLAALLALDIGGLWYFRNQLLDAREVRMVSMVASVASSIQMQIMLAFKPIFSVAALIHRVPQWQQVQPLLRPFLEEITPKVLYQEMKPQDKTRRFYMGIGPNGILLEEFPFNTPFHGTMGGTTPNADFAQVAKLFMMRKPVGFSDWDAGNLGAIYPIFISGVAENETFGIPMPWPVPAAMCPYCYDPTTKTKFWGVVVTTVLFESGIAQPREMDLSSFGRYAVVTPNDDKVLVLKSPNNTYKSVEYYNTPCHVYASSPELPTSSTPLRMFIKVDGVYDWWLLVEQDNHDIYVLHASVLTATVVGSVALCCLLFSTLVTGCKLQMLLESLVPDAVLKQVRKQAGFLDSSKPILTAGSPADLMLQVVSEVAAGRQPAISDALTVRTALLQNWDMFTPIDLKGQLKEGPLDDDVAQALMAQLLGQADTSVSRNSPNKAPGASTAPSLVGHAAVDEFSSISGSDRMPTVLALLMSDEQTRQSNSGNSKDGDFTLPASEPHPHTASPVEDAERVLAAATTTWQFDAFELAEATNGHPLSTLAYYLINKQGLITTFKLDAQRLARYLRRVEDGYRRNPYHNKRHAADVLQTMHMILTDGGLKASGYVDDLVLLAGCLSAVMHDFDHGGLTNDFLINTQDELACQYNDKSPLENHHIAAAWMLTKEKELSFMKQMAPADAKALRKHLIELVLATDMKQHFSIVTHFTANASHLQSGLTKASISQAKGADAAARPAVNEAEQLAVLQMALKCSDLGHTTTALPVHKRWLKCLEEEFFLQGDLEKSRGMPISPLFDRSKPGASKSQVGFYSVVVLPMYSAFCVAFPGASPLLEGAKANSSHWQAAQPPAAN